MRIWPGRPYPLGATWDGSGVNFAIFCENGTAVELCLFDSADANSESQKIRFTETKLIELRMEAFNVTNHNNYLLPLQVDINSTTFGQLTTARSEQSLGLDSPRRMQFAIRFEF